MKKLLKVTTLSLMMGVLSLTTVAVFNATAVEVEAASTGWQQDKNGWWYLNPNGTYPTNNWQQIGGKWYYFNGSGYMQRNKWVGSYYVLDSGEMAISQWIGNYYVGANGVYVPNNANTGWRSDSRGYWYQNPDGSYMRSAWLPSGGRYYYFNGSGYMLTNTWVGDYYVGSSGAMLTDYYVKGHYVDKTGRWATSIYAQGETLFSITTPIRGDGFWFLVARFSNGADVIGETYAVRQSNNSYTFSYAGRTGTITYSSNSITFNYSGISSTPFTLATFMDGSASSFS